MDSNKMTPFQRFWSLLTLDAKEIRNIYVYSIFSGLISLSLPLGIQSIVNLIQGGRINTSWIVLIVLVVLGVIITGGLQIFQLRITENLQQKIFTRAAFELSYRISRIRMEAIYKHYAPELMNRFFDITAVQKGLSKILIDFSSAFFIVIFSLVLLSFYHPFFILFSLILLILVYAIFSLTAKKGMTTSLKESKLKYRVAHWLEELSRMAITFKLAGRSELPLKETDEYVVKYLSARESHFKVLVQQYSFMVVFKVFVVTGLLAIGGALVMNQQMNIGQFIAAEIIILIIITSVEKLITSLESIYDILTSLEKIGQVTDLELDRQSGTSLDVRLEDTGMEIEIENLSFTYPKRDKKTLDNISLHLKKGDILVIAGGPGSGKSTLLHIIAGLYQIQDGVILYNKLPIGNITLESLWEQVGENMTTERLFEGSILNNLTLGRKMATFENVKWAIENLGLSGFIKKLPKGYDTMLNTQGKGLPKSVITKLLLARGIVAKPKLLLLENSFEYLDEVECKDIINFLTAKQNGWSLVTVSFNKYLAELSHKVIVLKSGKIEAAGTYEELKDTLHFKSNDNA